MDVHAKTAPPNFAPTSLFWCELREICEHELKRRNALNRSRRGDWRMQVKAVIVLNWFAISYYFLLTAGSLEVVVLTAISMGMAACAIGFNIFHDACHGTLFHLTSRNVAAARLCSVLIGPARYFWMIKHQGLHHRLPNVHEWDDDVDARGFLRLTPKESWRNRYRYQELKALLYYSFNTIEWFFFKDFVCLARQRLNNWNPVQIKRMDIFELIFSKMVYFLLFVLPPFVLLNPIWAFVAFGVFHFTFSQVLTWVFQAAHLTPKMAFDGVRCGDDWAQHQMRSTANFACNSRIMTWFTGGLNHQIEHHLFPNIAHSHYPSLRPYVQALAAKHDLPYHDLGGFWAACRQHFAHLQTLGARTND